MRLAVIMPCYGEHHYTDVALADLLFQQYPSDIYLVDNKGDYAERIRKWQDVYSPHHFIYLRGEGRRWLKGTNWGTQVAEECGVRNGFRYGAYIWLNNDVRLSHQFLSGIRDAFVSYTGGTIGLLAPSYDDVWPQQKPAYQGHARNYQPVLREKTAFFIDGSCMVVPHYTWSSVGPMDEQNFSKFGWGGDFDYALRVREKGWDIVVTERAYYNHLGGGTNKLLEENYHGAAGAEMNAGMTAKYGAGWQKSLGI